MKKLLAFTFCLFLSAICFAATDLNKISVTDEVHICDAKTMDDGICYANFGGVWLVDPVNSTIDKWVLKYENIAKTTDRADNVFYPIMCTYYILTTGTGMPISFNIAIDGDSQGYETQHPTFSINNKDKYVYYQQENIPPFNSNPSVAATLQIYGSYRPTEGLYNKLYIKCDQITY